MISSIIKNILVLLFSCGIIGFEVELSLQDSKALEILDLMLMSFSGVVFTISFIKLKNKITEKNVDNTRS